jgi:hypothetical protein
VKRREERRCVDPHIQRTQCLTHHIFDIALKVRTDHQDGGSIEPFNVVSASRLESANRLVRCHQLIDVTEPYCQPV